MCWLQERSSTGRTASTRSLATSAHARLHSSPLMSRTATQTWRSITLFPLQLCLLQCKRRRPCGRLDFKECTVEGEARLIGIDLLFPRLQGLGAMELDNLRDWEAKFNYKYPVKGTLV